MSQSIKVFGHTPENNFPEVDTIESKLFKRLLDIVACKAIMALYILDDTSLYEKDVRKSFELCIWQRDKNGEIIKYVHFTDTYATISISRRDLLVTSATTLSKCKHRSFTKPSVTIVSLPIGLRLSGKFWHALEIDKGYVIAHIERTRNAEFHRVSKLKESSRAKTNIEPSVYGNEPGEGDDQLSSPVYLALKPKYGHIFVADSDNNRVVVLTGDLARRLVISSLPEGCHPNRLCYVEERSELIVGMSNGLVIGYKFTR